MGRCGPPRTLASPRSAWTAPGRSMSRTLRPPGPTGEARCATLRRRCASRRRPLGQGDDVDPGQVTGHDQRSAVGPVPVHVEGGDVGGGDRADRLRLATVHPGRSAVGREDRASELGGGPRGRVGPPLLDLGQPELDVAGDVVGGEAPGSITASAKQLEGPVEAADGHVEHGLQPGQPDVHPEPGALGLEQLGELLAGVAAGPLVQAAGGDRGDLPRARAAPRSAAPPAPGGRRRSADPAGGSCAARCRCSAGCARPAGSSRVPEGRCRGGCRTIPLR